MILNLLRVLSDPDAYAVQIKDGEIYVKQLEDINPDRLYPKERNHVRAQQNPPLPDAQEASPPRQASPASRAHHR